MSKTLCSLLLVPAFIGIVFCSQSVSQDQSDELQALERHLRAAKRGRIVGELKEQVIAYLEAQIEAAKNSQTKPSTGKLIGKSSTNEAKPLKEAWSLLIPSKEQAENTAKLTSAKRYKLMNDRLIFADKEIEGKTYFLRLKVSGVIERLVYNGVYPNGLMLVHANYVDKEEQELFGKDATIAIWTQDFETANSLNVGEEIKLVGKIYPRVSYLKLSGDFDRFQSKWFKENKDRKIITTSVAFVRPDLTGYVRKIRIYMISPKIERLTQDR